MTFKERLLILFIKRLSGNHYIPINYDKYEVKNSYTLDVTKNKNQDTKIGLFYFNTLDNIRCSFIPKETDLPLLKKGIKDIEKLIEKQKINRDS